jgi:NADH-quinone oxidoreductase subunit N
MTSSASPGVLGAAQSIDYVALLPVLIVAGGALAVLVADLFLDQKGKRLLSWGTAVILLAALAADIGLWVTRTAVPRQTFCLPAPTGSTGSSGSNAAQQATALCSFSADNFSLALQILAIGATLLVVLMAPRDFRAPFGEYHFLVLCSLTGALVLVAARDFITLTVALETLSLPAFALVGFGRHGNQDAPGTSGEAALKFFLMSIASTAIMLFGISLVYGTSGSVYFGAVQRAAAQLSGYQGTVFAVAAVLTLAGFAFKVSAVPFHFWTPEVYSGAPVPIAAYLSVVSKSAGFAGLILAFDLAFRSYLHDLGVLIAVLAAVTMTVGNLIALRQRQAVRLLAWSTVAQAGYILVPLAVTQWNGTHFTLNTVVGANSLGPAVAASVAYLILYAVMNLGAFAVVSALSSEGDGDLTQYQGISRRRPRAAFPLAFFLLCLAGLPPGVMGLFAKVAVFKAAVSGDMVWLAVIMAVNVVIALYYYLRWAALLFAQSAAAPAEATAVPAPTSTLATARPVSIPLAPRLAVGLALALAVVLSVYPNPALDVLNLH